RRRRTHARPARARPRARPVARRDARGNGRRRAGGDADARDDGGRLARPLGARAERGCGRRSRWRALRGVARAAPGSARPERGASAMTDRTLRSENAVMRKRTSVTLDLKLFDEAKAVLQTTGTTETIHRALHETVRQARLRRLAARRFD